jgi:AraC-like DNA-binding protein
MDVLSDLLRSIRISGAVLFRAELSAPWAVAAPASQSVAPLLKPDAERLVLFHLVAEGECWVQIEGGERASIRAGDAILMCGGDPHVLGCGTPQQTLDISELLPPLPWPEPPRVSYGGGGQRTSFVCGFLHCDELLFHPFLRALPRLLRVQTGRSAEWALANLSYPLEEVRAGKPGSAQLLARSAELLLLDVLRRYIAERPGEELGWLGALRDPAVARALELLHESPAAPWSVEQLARRAGVSRSVLADRFRLHLGQPPMHYLACWRLQLAARLLRDDVESSVAQVAERVGYESEPAFNRAFKRHAGITPAAWRSSPRLRQ